MNLCRCNVISWPCTHFQGAGNSRREAWGGAGEWRPEEGEDRSLGQETLSRNNRRRKTQPEKLGQGTHDSKPSGGLCFPLCSKNLTRRSSPRNIFQRVGHHPFMAHKINAVGTHWHFLMK